jgi:hypothetical protein
MATQAQPLRMYHLPREVLDLIIQYVLRDTLLELGVAYDVHSPEFDEIVRANNKHLADLDDGLTLLLKLKPGPLSRDLLLRHATFCVRNVGIGNNFGRLNVLRYLQVTRQQYDILLRRFRRTAAFWEAFGEGGGALRTLTVCEVMRAGANSSTMRSVGYRLRSDRGLRRLASGFNGMFDDIVGFDAEGREICAPGLHRCRVILRLRIETVVPVVLTVSAVFLIVLLFLA